jgi:hypothetical protein
MTSTRTFTREQLDALGLPDECGVYPEYAEELHREQVDTRRWVSVHELIFRAPDDGKAWRVTYEKGLTEHQDDHDPWNYDREVTAVEVEQYDQTVKAWRPVEEHPADDEKPQLHPEPDEETRLAILDGRDALAFVVIRPADDADNVTVEAGSRGMSKAAAAYVLRAVADEFDDAARAEGDEPIPYTLTEQAEAEQPATAAVAQQ